MNNETQKLANEISDDCYDFALEIAQTKELQNLVNLRLYEFDATSSNEKTCFEFVESMALCSLAIYERMSKHIESFDKLSDKCFQLTRLADGIVDNSETTA